MKDETKKEETQNGGRFQKCPHCVFEYCTNACPIYISLEKRNGGKYEDRRDM